ncbi:MAG: penicillin-binding transpeptidase domain-containing protein, partial [Bacteroidota bacterium]
EAIAHSSNIVMAKVSDIIGPEKLYRIARDFGFGIPTGVDLPGEVRGRLKKPSEWSGTTLHTLSYGYEVAVTPLQIAAAYAAVANDGVLMKPFIVAQVRSKEGTVLQNPQVQKIRSVISPASASLITGSFERVIDLGTGKEVRVQGLRIAGKTGTSRKIVDGKYQPGSYTSSFAGFFPVEDPQVALLVMMDNPRAKGYYGGVTSGPVFRTIAERILQTSARFSRPSVIHTAGHKEKDATVPDVRHLRSTIAMKILEDRGLHGQLFGSGDVVVRQSPEPGARVEAGGAIRLSLNTEPALSAKGMITVPELRGMSMRRAINRLVIDDFDVQVEGSGIVVRHIPGAGSQAPVGTRVRLICEPRGIVSATLY